jgi:hypothetical protein
MAPKFNQGAIIAPQPKESKMSTIKSLVGKSVSKNVKFMGVEVTISKLSVAQVMEIQDKAKEGADQDNSALAVLQLIVSQAVDGASELTTEDFMSFPMDELSKLSNEIMKFSGVTGEQGK